MQIIAKVKYLCKHINTAIIPEQGLWNTIAIVIMLNSLDKNFDTTIASHLEADDKLVYQIRSIFQSREAKNLSKQIFGVSRDLAIAFRDQCPM